MTYPVMYTFRSKLWNFYLQKATIVPYLKQQQNQTKNTYTKNPTQTQKTTNQNNP